MNTRADRFFVILVRIASVLLMVESSVAVQGESSGWQAPYLQDHVLVDRIWDTHRSAWIPQTQFYRILGQYDFILLGEIHDHPDHHRLQAKAIKALVGAGEKPTVVMEMLAQEKWQGQPQIWHAFDKLQEKAMILNDGWPWALYAPVLESVVQHQLNLHAGNLSGEKLSTWIQEQPDKSMAEIYTSYAYDERNFARLKKDIIDSHCGYANEEMIQFMAHAQMQRDRVMAELLLEKALPVVFIAGGGHVRNDYAVPMQLRRQHRQTSYVSVAYVPVQLGMDHPQDYVQAHDSLYDFVYFTPSHTLEDPCEKFKKQLENILFESPSEPP